MTGDTSRLLCPKCRCKLIWNGKLYVCISCPYERPVDADSKGRRRPGK